MAGGDEQYGEEDGKDKWLCGHGLSEMMVIWAWMNCRGKRALVSLGGLLD
jgi:hypothetical protein